VAQVHAAKDGATTTAWTAIGGERGLTGIISSPSRSFEEVVNMHVQGKSSTKFIGAIWAKDKGLWKAQISYKGKVCISCAHVLPFVEKQS